MYSDTVLFIDLAVFFPKKKCSAANALFVILCTNKIWSSREISSYFFFQNRRMQDASVRGKRRSQRQHKKRRQKFLLLLNSAFTFFIRMNVAYTYTTNIIQYVAIIFHSAQGTRNISNIYLSIYRKLWNNMWHCQLTAISLLFVGLWLRSSIWDNGIFRWIGNTPDTKDTLHDDYYIPAANRLTTRAKVFLLTFLLSPNVCTDASSEYIRRAFVNGIRAPHYHHSVVRMYCILCTREWDRSPFCV